MDLTFVFPCLNEAETLPECIGEVSSSLEGSGISWEIVVADNGSSDGSAAIAVGAGARVVPVSERGYGAAIRGGIAAAEGDYVIFADADGSYRLEDTRALYQRCVQAGADMAVASRMTGQIEPGAMPFLHRFFGTPVLTGIIDVLFRGRLSDCNSGFRCLRKAAFDEWGIRATGMEFASELLIAALKHRSTIVEVPSGLRRDRRSRQPHLRTWRDGMRHLLFILSERPQLFEWMGILAVLLTSLLHALAFFMGPRQVLIFNVFDYHTQALLLVVGCAGTQIYLFSCYLFSAGSERCTVLTRRILALDEGHLFFLLVGLFAIEALGALGVVIKWMQADFAHLDMVRFMLLATHFMCVIGFVGVGLLGVHVLRNRLTGRG